MRELRVIIKKESNDLTAGYVDYYYIVFEQRREPKLKLLKVWCFRHFITILNFNFTLSSWLIFMADKVQKIDMNNVWTNLRFYQCILFIVVNLNNDHGLDFKNTVIKGKIFAPAWIINLFLLSCRYRYTAKVKEWTLWLLFF